MCNRFQMMTREEIEDLIAQIRAEAAGTPQNARVAAGGAAMEGASASRGPRRDAYPGSVAPVMVSLAPTDGPFNPELLACKDLNWGFPVEWQSRPVYNTRIESALGKPGMWARLIESGRCVVCTWAFYESHESERILNARGTAVRRPYRFSLGQSLDAAGALRVPTLLAGVQDGACFSVVTTVPNAWVKPVHGRMPLVLRASEVSQWLGGCYAALADRSNVELCVEPQGNPAAAGGSGLQEQLSLF